METRSESIKLIRTFNRRYVPIMRLLDRNYLETNASALEIAVLIEIGEHESVTARDIARLLSVDKGYLSRIISQFEKQGLVTKIASKKDARLRMLSLTETGRKRVAELSESGADVVTAAFEDASDEELAQAADAMSTILKILEGKDRTRADR